MKKTFVLMTALALSYGAVKAQKTSYGIKAGVQQNSFSMKSGDSDDWSRATMTGAGFHVGALANVSLTENISVQPAILFNSKGTVWNSESKLNMYSIDVPINFLYKTGGFFLGLGPNLSYGLSAKIKSDGETTDWYKKQPIGEGEEKSPLKRFEVGANATMGYQFKNNILISANYTQGISNLSNLGDGELGKIRTRQVGLSVGYILGK